ncbi:MAG: hypothetical protein V3T70_07245, partial [Phycisphaerae bacterium]
MTAADKLSATDFAWFFAKSFVGTKGWRGYGVLSGGGWSCVPAVRGGGRRLFYAPRSHSIAESQP